MICEVQSKIILKFLQTILHFLLTILQNKRTKTRHQQISLSVQRSEVSNVLVNIYQHFLCWEASYTIPLKNSEQTSSTKHYYHENYHLIKRTQFVYSSKSDPTLEKCIRRICENHWSRAEFTNLIKPFAIKTFLWNP